MSADRGVPSRAELEDIAIGHTGFEDFGDAYFRDGLDTLLGSLAARIVEIPYAEIRADAPRAAARFYERAGLDYADDTQRRFGDFAAANRQHSHGVHRYRPEDFGATTAAIRASFGDFAELFAASAIA